jgi:hypothetical protein
MSREPTSAQTIRLTNRHWRKLRALMQLHGDRRWLEKLIEREAKRRGVSNDQQSVEA